MRLPAEAWSTVQARQWQCCVHNTELIHFLHKKAKEEMRNDPDAPYFPGRADP